MRAILLILSAVSPAVFAGQRSTPRLPAFQAPMTPDAAAAPSLSPSAAAGEIPILPQSAVEPGIVPSAEGAAPAAQIVNGVEVQGTFKGAEAELVSAENGVAKAASAGGSMPDEALKASFDGSGIRPEGEGAPQSVVHFRHEGASLGAEVRRHQPWPDEPILPVPPELADDVPSARERAPYNWTGRISLHLHSVYSDGTLTPSQLIEEAYKQGVRIVSLTDHDTTAGLEEASKRAAELGMTFIAGEEMTARGGVHIGAIGIDPSHPALIAHNERVRINRLARAQTIIDHLNAQFRDHPSKPAERGLLLTIDEVKAHSRYDQGGTIEIPSVARVLVDHGLIEHVDDAYNTYLTPKVMSDPSIQPDPKVEEVLDVIHRAGGKAFLNHPYTVRANSEDEKQQKIKDMLSGFDGIEAYRDSNATSPDGKKRFDGRVAQYLTYALDKEHPLLVGNGADYHGPDTHLNQLAVWMPKKYAGALLEGLGIPQAKSLLDDGKPAAPSVAGVVPAAVLLAASVFDSHPLLILAGLMALVAAYVLGGAYLTGEMMDALERKRGKDSLLRALVGTLGVMGISASAVLGAFWLIGQLL